MQLRSGWALIAIFTIQFLVALDMSLVTIALPSIRDELGFDDSGLQAVVNVYLLTMAGFQLLGGRLGDLLGRRPLMIASLALFAVASLWGGLATAPWHLVSARAGQGLAAAALSPMSLALAQTLFPEGPLRVRALGLWGAAGALGGAVGVLAGGLLTEFAGWRWVMLVNIAIVGVALLAGLRGVPASRAAAPTGRPDILGALLVTTGIAAVVYGVSGIQQAGVTAPAALVPLVGGLLLLAAFIVVERFAAQPLMPLTIFRHRAVVGANLFGFLLTAGQLAGFYFCALYVQRVMGYTPLEGGLAFLPFSAGVIIGINAATRLVPRLGPRVVLAAGGALAALGLIWFGRMTPDGSFLANIVGPSMVTSIGMGACFVAMGGAATTGVPDRDAGVTSGVLNSSRQLGGVVGLAVLATVAAHVTGTDPSPAAAGAGYTTGFTLGGIFMFVAALCAFIVPRGGAAPGRGAASEVTVAAEERG